jgi:hypothetical protein
MEGQRSSVRIDLPAMSGSLKGAHPYPFQIGMQTNEFIQAALFHASFLDIAVGKFVRLPDGLREIEEEYVRTLGSQETYDEAWSYLEKYQAVFQDAPLQSVLIAFTSHWDWYLRALREFIISARSSLSLPRLKGADEKSLACVDYLPMPKQLDVLVRILGIEIGLSDEDAREVDEMTLVRNLGLHNRWEVDGRYLQRTPRTGYELGELRLVHTGELQRWHTILTALINVSASKVARDYAAAPKYPNITEAS